MTHTNTIKQLKEKFENDFFYANGAKYYDVEKTEFWNWILSEIITPYEKQLEQVEREKEEERNNFMQKTQLEILKLMQKKDINDLTLRQIGAEIGVMSPQNVKHHINMLVKYGHINIISGKYKLAKNEK